MSGDAVPCACAGPVARATASATIHLNLCSPTSRNPPQRVARILASMILAHQSGSEPRKWDGLLLHDSLHEVARAIDIDAVLERHVVGEHLQRNDLWYGQQVFVCRLDLDEIRGDSAEPGIAGVAEHDGASPCALRSVSRAT